MSAKGFTNELARAQERPDCEELLRKLTVHHQFNLDHDKGLKPTWAEECDFVTMSGTGLSEPDDPEITLALVALAAATFDEKSYLGMMAAGPLENLLRNSNPNLLNRVIEEARRNERFKCKHSLDLTSGECL